MKQYRIQVPKPGASDETGMQVRLYEAGEMVEATEEWQQNVMDAFVANGWAVETKVDAPAEVKRARNADGTMKGDDPKTADVNEAWEGGKAPKKKAAPRKKAPAKKKPAAKK